MAFPSGLHFRERIAHHGGFHFFQCAQAHVGGPRRVRRQFRSDTDLKRFITRHDAKFHDRLLARELGIAAAPTLGAVVKEFIAHIEKLVSEGKRDRKTLDFYRSCTTHLEKTYGAGRPIDSIGGRPDALEYVRKRKDNGSQSEGVRLIKELRVAQRLQKFAGYGRVWEIPVDDISPVHHEREEIPLDDIRDFLRALDPASVEHAFAVTKFVTMMRNEELYAANVGDVDLETRTLEYELRNKRLGARLRHVTHLPEALAVVLSPLVVGRPAGAPLFSLDGKRRMTHTTLRKRFAAASAKATSLRLEHDPKAEPVEIAAIGQFTHEATTLVMDELGAAYPVTEQRGHRDEKTTRRHYKLPRRKATLKQSERVTELTSKLIH